MRKYFVPRGYKLSHIFFADDGLLFCRVDFSEWCQIFRSFRPEAKQCKNSYFKDHIQSVMRVAATKGYEKYLGLPALVGCSKLKAFANIQERV